MYSLPVKWYPILNFPFPGLTKTTEFSVASTTITGPAARRESSATTPASCGPLILCETPSSKIPSRRGSGDAGAPITIGIIPCIFSSSLLTEIVPVNWFAP